jgi:hypothetical protein
MISMRRRVAAELGSSSAGAGAGRCAWAGMMLTASGYTVRARALPAPLHG